jgi:hypothetical protein
MSSPTLPFMLDLFRFPGGNGEEIGGKLVPQKLRLQSTVPSHNTRRKYLQRFSPR